MIENIREASRTGRLAGTFVPAALAIVAFLAAGAAMAGPIRWAPNLANGYDRGVAERKPIVVVFYDRAKDRVSADAWSTRLSLNPRIQAIQDTAIWCYADVSREIVAKNIAKALGIDELPAISVLEPEGDALYESARVADMSVMPITASTQAVEDFLIGRIATVAEKWRRKH